MMDAFIGIDIDVEDDTAERAGESSKKRSLQTKPPRATAATTAAAADDNESTRKRPKKPRPPQPPPPSLISLLQKDASVRSYFQSLQENLDYDVEKWKHEATTWKQRLLASTKIKTSTTASTTNNGRRTREGASKRASSTLDLINEKRTRTSGSLKNVRSKNTISEVDLLEEVDDEDEDVPIPITDEVLFGDLSDDDDDSSQSSSSSSCSKRPAVVDSLQNDDEIQSKTNNDQTPETTSNLVVVDDSVDRRLRRRSRSRNILENLQLAKKKLELLGISLVEVKTTTTTTTTSTLLPSVTTDKIDNDARIPQATNSTGGEDIVDKTIIHHTTCEEDGTTDNPPPTITKTERILHRQPDEKVAAEIMASLRTLIKSSSFIGASSRIDTSGGKIDDLDDFASGDDDACDLDQGMNQEELLHRTRLRRYYHPFCGGGVLHVPNVYYSKYPVAGYEATAAFEEENSSFPDHPAAVGLRHLVDTLILMDTYCGDNLDDDDWRAIFAENGDGCGPTVGGDELLHEDMTILQIGMKNRHRLTERIVSSLDVEITRVWALTDRTTNLATPSMHFHPADVLDMNDPENKNIHNNFFGAKNYNRLVVLEERVAHARMATLLHRRRGNLQLAAELVVGYIISTAPSLGAEQYPKLPPLLSLCVLEALLSPENYIPMYCAGSDGDSTRDKNPAVLRGGWFRACIQDVFTTRSCSDSILLKALAHPVHIAARLWRDRQSCADDRIRDIATVEVAAYERIQRLDDGGWLSGPITETMTIEHITMFGMLSPLSTPVEDDYGTSRFDSYELLVVSIISMTVLLLILGEVDEVLRLSEAIMRGMKHCHNGNTSVMSFLFLLPGCCVAYSNIMCRRWESMKLGNTSGRQTAAAFTIEDKFTPILDSILQGVRPDDWQAIDTLVQCCVLLGDGGKLLKLAERVVPTIIRAFISQKTNTVPIAERKLMSNTLMALVDAGEVPTIRVINLKRRPDRKYDFIACAVNKEQLIVLQGPSKLRRKDHVAASCRPNASYISSDHKEDRHLGYYAFDGQCSRGDLEKQLLQRLDGKGTLTDFVNDEWRPSELKAFDANARGDFELVSTSMTEKACALSHISSWMGVEKTLAGLNSTIRNHSDSNEWYQTKLLGMLSISGFARGPALLKENEGMDPVPVCVILEDDAILNDRFSERLTSLLEELPRDFHFCSLGYSRPKAAPMIDFSTHLGIPSCLWYLTGYILSLEGARHLIASLPVTGPVDSWIGLKMCGNWDNQYGDIMGVGKGSTSYGKVTKKDLAKIMNFRAFAALVPLCAQKVGTSAASTMTRGGWRDRDTDITYSG